MRTLINKLRFADHKHFYGIFLIALLLRIIGLSHGYPYVFNIDEPAIVRSALGLRFSPEIGHFDWPHFSFYLNFVFYFIFIKLRGLAQAIGAREMLERISPIIWNDPFVFYFITRLLNAILSVLTLIPVYLLAKRMFSKEVGLIAASLFALIPYDVYISHVGIPDPILLFFVTWAFYFSYKFSLSLKYKDLILAGIFFGVASSIKYNAIILSMIIVLFTFYQLKITNRLNPQVLKGVFVKLVVFGIVALCALLTTSPTIITDWDIFWSYKYGKGFLWQLTQNSAPLGLAQYFPILLLQFKAIIWDTGIVIPIFFIYGIYKASTKNISKDNKISIYVTSFVTFAFILFMARYARSTSHYFIPMYSLLVIIAAWGLNTLKSKLVTVLTFGVLFVFSVYNMMLFVREDTRSTALKYYETAREQGGKIYYEGTNLMETDVNNNLNMKNIKKGYDLGINDIVMTQTPIQNNDKIVLIQTIGNSYRSGPTIYVYKKAM